VSLVANGSRTRPAIEKTSTKSLAAGKNRSSQALVPGQARDGCRDRLQRYQAVELDESLSEETTLVPRPRDRRGGATDFLARGRRGFRRPPEGTMGEGGSRNKRAAASPANLPRRSFGLVRGFPGGSAPKRNAPCLDGGSSPHPTFTSLAKGTSRDGPRILPSCILLGRIHRGSRRRRAAATLLDLDLSKGGAVPEAVSRAVSVSSRPHDARDDQKARRRAAPARP